MDRRTALFSTMMLGGLLGRVARGQDRRSGFRPAQAMVDEPALDPDLLGIGTVRDDENIVEHLRECPSARRARPFGLLRTRHACPRRSRAARYPARCHGERGPQGEAGRATY